MNNLVKFGKYKDKSFVWVAKNDPDFFIQIEKLYFKKYSIKQRNYYKVVYKKFIKEEISIKPEIVQEVVSLLKDKKTSNEIANFMKDKISKYEYDKAIVSANQIIRKEFDLNKEYMIDEHLLRYESIFEELKKSKPPENMPANYRKAFLAEKYLYALDTLFQKEKLLGIHSKHFKIPRKKITDRSDVEYDLSVLNLSEQIELLSILNKAKPVKEIIKPITSVSKEDEIEEAVVVEEIKNTTPVKNIEETDIIGDDRRKEIESRGSTLDDVKEKVIKASLADKIKEMYNKKQK